MFYINCEHNFFAPPSCTFEHNLAHAVPLQGLNVVSKFETSTILNLSLRLNLIKYSKIK